MQEVEYLNQMLLLPLLVGMTKSEMNPREQTTQWLLKLCEQVVTRWMPPVLGWATSCSTSFVSGNLRIYFEGDPVVAPFLRSPMSMFHRLPFVCQGVELQHVTKHKSNSHRPSRSNTAACSSYSRANSVPISLAIRNL